METTERPYNRLRDYEERIERAEEMVRTLAKALREQAKGCSCFECRQGWVKVADDAEWKLKEG